MVGAPGRSRRRSCRPLRATRRPPSPPARPAGGRGPPATPASPTRRGRAYEVWAEFATLDLHFSRTSGRGATWAPPTLLDQPGPAGFDLSPRLVVLPDRTLLTVFARAEFDVG